MNDTDELLKALVRHGVKLSHDLSQPLTFLLTSLEMGATDGGLNPDDCQLLLEATLQMRVELQAFRDTLREAEND